jgi:hypothetical protein
MADYITVKSGVNKIEIDKDKVKLIELKSEGIINLIYENESSNISAVLVDASQDPDGFTEVLTYMGELDGGYTT